ncbi:MAG: Wzz/FepE/Etk N-terminal domain-containing protein [Methylotenera sp.]|nr:Wzz/FepE/Etk N-terminal domain-containing protein [Methylotenera sp.]
MTTDYELTLRDYLAILTRRKFHIAGVFSLVLAISVAVALLIPPVYQSVGTILVESQQIPTEMVKSSENSFADERIEVIKQRVMTRANLLRIIDKYDLYKDAQAKLQPSEIVEEMRKDISVSLLSADKGSGRGKTTIAFQVSFDYRYPDLAHKVTNEIVTLFLDENAKSRTERAAETNEFLMQEADRLKKELEEVENKVATYKQQYANALPEHLELHMGMIQRSESELKDVEREYKSTQEELRYQEIELEAAKAGVGGRSVSQQHVSPETELDKLKNDLVKASAAYKENHPVVKSLKRKIELLEKSLASQSPGTSGTTNSVGNASDPEAALRVEKIRAQIESSKARLQSLAQQQSGLKGKMGQLEGKVILTPQIERGLLTLERDYENAKAKYDEIRSKQNNAKIAENLEQENKAERFSLLEAPLMPDKPIKPNRKKMLVMGFFLAIAAAFGLVMLMETLDKRVRGVEFLTSVVGMRPIGIVPYIKTQAELNQNRGRYKYIALGVVVFLIIALILVHFLWMPLDMLVYKVMAKLE